MPIAIAEAALEPMVPAVGPGLLPPDIAVALKSPPNSFKPRFPTAEQKSKKHFNLTLGDDDHFILTRPTVDADCDPSLCLMFQIGIEFPKKNTWKRLNFFNCKYYAGEFGLELSE